MVIWPLTGVVVFSDPEAVQGARPQMAGVRCLAVLRGWILKVRNPSAFTNPLACTDLTWRLTGEVMPSGSYPSSRHAASTRDSRKTLR